MFACVRARRPAGPDATTKEPRVLSNMIETIIRTSLSDNDLAALVDEAREYAQIYLLAKQRHKGCDGTGELMTLREEFKDAVDKMVRYCRENNCLSGSCAYEPDLVAEALVKMAGS